MTLYSGMQLCPELAPGEVQSRPILQRTVIATVVNGSVGGRNERDPNVALAGGNED